MERLAAMMKAVLHLRGCEHVEVVAQEKRTRNLNFFVGKSSAESRFFFFWFALKLGRRHSWWGEFGEGKKIKSAEYDVRFGVMSNILERK
jgi:hypothetical protein